MYWLKGSRGRLLTSGYHRDTFTGLYTKWNSFVPKLRKINLISTFFYLALMICSPCNLEKELAKIYNIFLDNCYPQNVLKRFKAPVVFGHGLCSD